MLPRARTAAVAVIVTVVIVLGAPGCSGGGGGGNVPGGGGGAPGAGSVPCMAGTFECETLALINAERAMQNPPLPPLSFNPELYAAALFHNDWMVENDCFSHGCMGEPALGARIAAAGYDAMGAGETIAAGYPTPAAVVAGWMNSPGHRAILLSDLMEVGIAYAECPMGCQYGTYWTADFGSR